MKGEIIYNYHLPFFGKDIKKYLLFGQFVNNLLLPKLSEAILDFGK